jgi:hypothetical protein
VYRSMLRCYPRDFRTEYRDDLVDHFCDLVADRGVARAWMRTAADLIVTVPRYRMEHIMSEQASTTTLSVVIGVLALAGVASVLVGVYPGAAVLLVVALVLAFAQRGSLARAVRTPDPSRRRKRLRLAAILGVVFVVSIASFLWDTGNDEISGLSLILHNVIGNAAMLGAIGFLIAGLLTPRGTAMASAGER